MNDCAEVYQAGGTDRGYYLLTPAGIDESDSQPRRHYCDGEGWTLIMARGPNADASVESTFASDAITYHSEGINHYDGMDPATDVDPPPNYLMDFDEINRITSSGSAYDLKVQLWDSDGVYGEANYAGFSVDAAGNVYAMTVTGYSGAPSGDLTDAGDALGFADFASGVDFIASGTTDTGTCQSPVNPGW